TGRLSFPFSLSSLFQTRYRPSLFPLYKEPKAHQVRRADCVILCSKPDVSGTQQKTADRALSASGFHPKNFGSQERN
ncbi:hypothetical protein ABS241_20480, partial [Acinetobacter baumannii]|uniref:hypothetical protein n=1 Tax=Acinetobacter baumannii TaxID=470 RepID=UPI00333102BB